MTIDADQFGILSRAADLRARYGDRKAHGKVRAERPMTATMATLKPPSRDPRVQAVNPFLARAAGLYLRGYLDGTATRRTIPLAIVPIQTLVEALATYTGEPVGIAISPRRSRSLARPRQAAMFLARHYTTASLPEIGRAFGNRDHTTAMHGVEKIEDRLRRGDNDTRHQVKTIATIAGLDIEKIRHLLLANAGR